MKNLIIPSHTTNTILLVAFLAMWLYTKVTEDVARDAFQEDLLKRIERLESYIGEVHDIQGNEE